MPSKLRKAIGAVKDQTSISLAKVSSATTINLEVPILKATSHDEVPIEDRYLFEILQAIAANKVYAAAATQVIAKRVGRTRNWVVALKSLMLVFRVFQNGDPHFPREVFYAMKQGSKILNLSNFRDDSNSSPWDYTAFVRTFALYLDERLDCFISGKLHQRRRYSFRPMPENEGSCHVSRRATKYYEAVRDMKPATLIDRISYWQKLLDRAIATRPTGEAKTNRLVKSSLHAIVQESFDLYRDISDGLALLLDSFFHLQYQSCVNAFQASVRASKQFEELSEFYGLCKSIGVGRTSEYPSVQKISDELIETLQEFLKDQASFPGRSPPSKLLLALPPAVDLASTSGQSETPERVSAKGSESGSECSTPDDEDQISPADSETDQLETEETEKQPQMDKAFIDANKDDQNQESRIMEEKPRDYWELILVNTANKTEIISTPNIESNGHGPSTLNTPVDQQQYNPFLQETTGGDPHENLVSFPGNAFFTSHNPNGTPLMAAPTFSARNDKSDEAVAPITVPPTFCVQNPYETMRLSSEEEDPFASVPSSKENQELAISNGSVVDRRNESLFVLEQQSWLEHQQKIISKRVSR